MAEHERFGIKCASRGFHVYRDIWKPKLSQLLEVFHEQGNVHDPFAMVFKVKSAAMLTKAVIGHTPKEFIGYADILWITMVSYNPEFKTQYAESRQF